MDNHRKEFSISFKLENHLLLSNYKYNRIVNITRVLANHSTHRFHSILLSIQNMPKKSSKRFVSKVYRPKNVSPNIFVVKVLEQTIIARTWRPLNHESKVKYLRWGVCLFKYSRQLFLGFITVAAFVVFMSSVFVFMSRLAFVINVHRFGIHHNLVLVRCCSWLPERKVKLENPK